MKGGGKMNIGQRIKERRKELKMSADELGKRLGKDRSTIYRYEKGDIENLPLDILEPIAKALETTPQYLMGWEKVQKNNDTISSIVVRLRTDADFLSLVETLNELDQGKILGVKQMLSAFLE
jgi:transcriptional regulator with XRE-family HTH domain